jgi:hypothetical protein
MAIEEKSVHQQAGDQYVKAYEATFAAGTTRATAVNLDGRAPIRIIMDSAYSKTAGPTLRVQLSTNGTTFSPLWVNGTAYTVAVKPSQSVRIDPTLFWGVQHIRLLSTLARGTASTQHASVVTIIARLI